MNGRLASLGPAHQPAARENAAVVAGVAVLAASGVLLTIAGELLDRRA